MGSDNISVHQRWTKWRLTEIYIFAAYSGDPKFPFGIYNGGVDKK